MKMMHKILAVLAFAGVFAGGAYGAARGADVAEAANRRFGGLVKDGFKAEDLNNSAADVLAAFEFAHAAVWTEIEGGRVPGEPTDREGLRSTRRSFTCLMTTQEVFCVIDGLASVVKAYEAAADVIFTVRENKRHAYRDAVLAAIDRVRDTLVCKIKAGVKVGFFQSYNVPGIVGDAEHTGPETVNARIDALKARVTAVFTDKPTVEALAVLHAGRGGVLVDDLHPLPPVEPRFGFKTQFCGTSVLALIAVYGIPALWAYFAATTGAPVA